MPPASDDDVRAVIEADERWIEAFNAADVETLVTELTPLSGGPTRTESGKHLVIWRRESDGQWRAARDIWNGSDPTGL